MLAVGMSMVPAAGVIVFTGLEHREHWLESARAEALRQAEAFAELQARMTASTRQLLSTLASLPGFRRMNRVYVAEILAAVHAANPEYLNFTVLDELGKVDVSLRLPAGTDLSGRDHVKAALGERRFFAGQYILNLLDASPTIAYAFPIIGYGGAPVGAITTSMELTSYAGLFNRLTLPPGSLLGLVDRNGVRLFFHPPRESNPIGGKIKGSVWDGIRSEGESGVFTDTGSDGIERFYAYEKLRLEPDQDPYMYVVYGAPTSMVYEKGDGALRRNVALMLAVAAIGIAGAALLSGPLFGSRLDRIVGTAARLRDGDLAARVGLEGDPSDLGQIATALDRLAAETERRERERVEHARAMGASLAEKEILLKEIHHRVKNNLQLIQSLLNLQADAPGTIEEFESSMSSRIAAMATVHQMIYESGNLAAIGLGDYARRIVESVPAAVGREIGVSVSGEAFALLCDLDAATPFGLLLNELVSSAIGDAAANAPRVSLLARGYMATLEIRVDGASPGLADRSSLGHRLCLALAAQLGGELARSDDEAGSTFRTTFSVERSTVSRGDAGLRELG